MIVNQSEFYIEEHTDTSCDIEYSHYYISNVNLVSNFKNEYLKYVNLWGLNYYYNICYIEYWMKKDI